MSVQIHPMQIDDYQAVVELWDSTDGVFLSDADTPSGMRRYLARNPSTSFVAKIGDHVVGAVLCGHDGRRASIHHLAVAVEHRGSGIGRELVSACIDALTADGISTSYIFVLNSNDLAVGFWHHLGWDVQDDFAAFRRQH